MEWDQVLHGSCLDILPMVPSGSVDLVATDPPFNIGLKYDLYEDKKGYNEYLGWTRLWVGECSRVLAPNGSIWVCIGDEYAAEMNIILKEAGFFFRNWVVWRYGFGQCASRKFARCHTHLLYFTKSNTDFVFNVDDIRVPSDRQLKYKDKRANPLGKIPEDVWDISRVCGTFGERLKDVNGSSHPCQLPLELADRIIKGSSCIGGCVVDLFSGTGTFSASAKRLGRRYLTMDVSAEYCGVARERLASIQQCGPDVR